MNGILTSTVLLTVLISYYAKEERERGEERKSVFPDPNMPTGSQLSNIKQK